LARADAARALVRRGYTWQAVADQVSEVYEAVRNG
jgi:glycosyltransferase involved in cell wall biosynthesis